MGCLLHCAWCIKPRCARCACRAGEGGLDGARFVKLVRETGLLGRGLTTTRVDLIFAKVAGKVRGITSGAGQRRAGALLPVLAPATPSGCCSRSTCVPACTPPQARRISYGQFVGALELLAEARKCSIVEVRCGPWWRVWHATCMVLPSAEPSCEQGAH